MGTARKGSAPQMEIKPLWLRLGNGYQLRHIEDSLNHGLVTNRGIDHEMEEMTGRPLHVEVLFDEGRAVAVHGLGQLNGFLLALAHGPQAVHLLFKGGIDKDVKGIGTVAEIICRPASHDDVVTLFRRRCNYSLSDLP